MTETGRWSPYPVQDWSQLPFDPLANREVDPAWAPPGGPVRRTARRPLLIIGLVLAVVTGGMYLADARSVPPTSATARFLPPDGAVSYVDRVTTQGGRQARRSLVTESARQPGIAALLSLDQTLTREVFRALDAQAPTGQQFWRTTTTAFDSLGGTQQVRLYRVGEAVELLAESGPDGARTYRPGLTELPADARVGQHWGGSGTSGDLHYRTEFAATAGPGACLHVTGVITLADTSGAVTERRTRTTVWCPGANPIVESETLETPGQSAVQTVDRSVSAPAAPKSLATTAPSPSWGDPAGWRSRTYDAMSIDQTFGSGTMQGLPGAAPPVITASGLLIRASSADDLVAFTPKTRTQWTSVWRMRPGGRVLSLAVFGNVVLATTSQRRVVAYADTGIRLWSRDLSELAFQPAARLDTDAAVVVDAAGQVSAIDLRTGSLRWQVDAGVEVTAAPVVGRDVVVIIDGGGTVHAYAATDGAERWSAGLEATRGTVLDDEVVLYNGNTLTALDLDDGHYRWLRPTLGTADDLQTFDGHAVLATRVGTTVLDADGRTVAQLPPYTLLTVQSAYLIGWGSTQAEVRRADFALAATWDTPDQTNASGDIQAVASRQGVLRFTTGWQWLDFSDAP